MKIELTIQELLEIIDVIKYGENNEGDDFYLMQDFISEKDTKLKCTECGASDDVMFSAARGFMPYCKKCTWK